MTNQTAVTILKNLEQSLDDYCELNDEGKEAFRMAITALELFGISEQLPSAQPEKRTEKYTETHSCDLISRQATIDALEKVAELFPWRVPGNRDSYDHYNEAWNDAIGRAEIEIEKLPSAQPDTDMVSRQLMRDLGAMCIARRNEADDLVAILSIDLLPPASESNAPKTLDDNCLSPTKEANTSDRSIN